MNQLTAFPASPFEALLAPLAPDDPCGPALRYDPVFTAIRLLREEDDPTLPMGQWERPLTHADWARIEQLCMDVLATRSKDLQIAAWLAEAWMRQRGLAGLRDGLALLAALLRNYWAQLHPAIDADGDADARLAPFEWLNESLAASVRVHAVLLTLGDGKPYHLTLAGWERMTLQEMAPGPGAGARAQAPAAEPEVTRGDVAAAVWDLGDTLAEQGALVGQCQEGLGAIVDTLHLHLGEQAPSLGKFDAVLEGALRVLAQLYGVHAADGGEEPDPVDAAAPVAAEAVPDAAPVPAHAPSGGHWRNRAEAYATLGALADYLSGVEPHSPTPFLIRRAVSWGNMSLPEVIAEIIREDGDVSRFFNVLGVKT